MTEAAKVRSAETAGAVRVKVCGLRRLEDVAAVNAVRPDYAGWIFVPGSRRQVTAEQAAGLRERLDPAIVPVGVFRDAPVQQIARLAAAGVIAVAQLHGDEDAVYIASLRALAGPLPVVKAVSVTGPASVRRPSAAAGPLRPTDPAFPADCLLFDNGAGGSGQPFDLSLISQARQADALTEKPFFIAGGVGAAVIGAVLALNPYGVDLNSGVETDGRKDPAKLRQLVEAIRRQEAWPKPRPGS